MTERERAERMRLQVQPQAAALVRPLHPGERGMYGAHPSLHRSPQAPSSYRAPVGMSREVDRGRCAGVGIGRRLPE